MSVSPTPRKNRWWRTNGRIRPGLRAILFVLLVVALYVAAGFGFSRVLKPRHLIFLSNPSIAMLIQVSFQSLVVFVASWLMSRVVEKRPWADMGYRLQGAGHRVLQGILLGVGMQALVILLGLLTGAYRLTWNWTANGEIAAWLLYFISMALVGYSEEGMVRGYLLQSLAESLGKGWAAFLTAALFATMHLLNPGAGLASTLGILVFGLFAAYSIFATGSMWIAMVMHMHWNISEGIIFGLPNSGLSVPYSLWTTKVQGPEWWTGGNFGPEAGLISTLAILTGAVALHMWNRQEAEG